MKRGPRETEAARREPTNVRGEPIVCTPQDAYRCFMRTEMDVLVLENCIVYKDQQKPLADDSDWKKEFELD